MEKHRANNFDFLRFLAAFQVLVLHHVYLFFFPASAPPSYNWLDKILWNFPGVNIFFLISGYLIVQSLTNNEPKRFAIKRLKRIYPALFVCFLVTVCFMLVTGAMHGKFLLKTDFLKWGLAQLTVFQFYNPAFARQFGFGPPNGALWTICVELQFYVLMGLVWYGYLRNRSKTTQNLIFSLLFVVSGLFNYWFHNYLSPSSLVYKFSFVSIFSYLYFFCVGALVSVNRDTVQSMFKGRLLWWFVGFLMVCILITLLKLRYHRYEFNLLSVVMLVLLTGLVFSFAFSNKINTHKFIKGNDISYGMYLYQMPVLNLFVQLHINNGIWQFVGSLIVCIVFGIISWLIVEKPILKR